MTRHSYQDAVDEATWTKLWVAAQSIDDWATRVQAKFILVACGRLGLRAGEAAHFQQEWVDWENRIIQIPMHDPCTKGRDGGICGYCAKRAREAVAHNDDLTLEQAKAARWEPKTSNSARAIPFEFDDRVRETLEEFVFHYDSYPCSRASVNRRVNQILRESQFDEDLTYPHALRASAAMYHAMASVTPSALQSLFGWANLQTAQKYIRLSGTQTRDQVEDAHSDD